MMTDISDISLSVKEWFINELLNSVLHIWTAVGLVY